MSQNDDLARPASAAGLAGTEAAAAEDGATRGNVGSPLPGWLRRLFGRDDGNAEPGSR